MRGLPATRAAAGWRGVGAAFGVLLVTACTAPAATSTPTAISPSPAAASPSPTATDTPSPTASPTPEAAAGTACEPEPPTALSDGWVEFTGFEGHYRFAHPADWEPRSEPIPLPIVQSVSPETFEETGFPEFGQHGVDLISAPDGSAGFSAWVIDARIDTPTDELFERELAWLESQPQVEEVLDTGLEFCIDGEPALGFESRWTFPTGLRDFLIYTLQRNGRIYQVQLNAEDGDEELLHEILRTWSWIGPAAEDTTDEVSLIDFATTDFNVAGVTPELDQSLDDPDPSTFADVFPDDARIWLVYQLDPGVADTVLFTWRYEGEAIVENEFDYTDDTTYAWAWLDPAPGGFELGDYQVELELEGSGDRITIPFTVEG